MMVVFDEDTKTRIVQLAHDMASVEEKKLDAVASQDFEQAALLRRQEDDLRQQLGRFNLPDVVLSNIGRLTRKTYSRYPILDLLQPEARIPDSVVVDAFPLPLVSPTRLVVEFIPSSPATTLSSALATDDICSPYFRAVLPVFSPDTLKPVSQGKQAEFVWAAFREVQRCKDHDPIVVSALRPTELDDADLLDGILRGLEEADCDFAVFEQRDRLAALLPKVRVDYTLVDR